MTRTIPMEKPVFEEVNGFEVVFEPPTVDEYLHFRKIGGLGVKDRASVQSSLDQSVFSVQVRHNGRCVGFCRLLGDGGLWYFMVDGVVLPEYQADGIGKFVVSMPNWYFYENAPAGAFLFGVTHVPGFTLKCGFTLLPQEYQSSYAWVPPFDTDGPRPENPVKQDLPDIGFSLVQDLPDEQSYHELREKCGLVKKDQPATGESFSNTLRSVCIFDEGELIGMARILGDSGLWYYMVDIMAHPNYDRNSLIEAMTHNLTSWFFDVAPPGGYMIAYTDHDVDLSKTGLIPLPEREVPLFTFQKDPADLGSML